MKRHRRLGQDILTESQREEKRAHREEDFPEGKKKRELAYFVDLERLSFEETWSLQKKIHSRRVRNEIPDTLIFVEHDHVYTFGRKGKAENLLVSEDFLRRKGAQVFRVERGGDVTYHGPGQLVGYPIFHIRQALAGVRSYVRLLEEALIDAIGEFKVRARRIEGLTGIWVGEKKIVAVGIAVSRWVSFHGFAFNVCTDLSYFDMIVPCGIKGRGVTSLSQVVGGELHLQEVKPVVLHSIEKVFKKNFLRVSLDEVL